MSLFVLTNQEPSQHSNCLLNGSNTWPETAARLEASFKGLPDYEIAAILGGNAAAVYGFDVAKLAPLVARIGPEKRAFRAA